MKTIWIKHCVWALLSFTVAFVMGGGGSLLWNSYVKDLPRQLPAAELEQAQREMMNEIDRSIIRTGFICGFCGLTFYFIAMAKQRMRASW